MTALWITSRQAELIGWAMSACSLTRPSASRVARSSSSLPPHWLQKRARRWFLQPHPPQRSVSLRLGMATNEPLVPSMIFRSRTTKASSNVTEQKACRRSFSLLSSMSLIRTSVMTTSVLPNGRWHTLSIATPDYMHTGRRAVLTFGRPGACYAQGVGGIAGQGEDRAAGTRHQHPCGGQPPQSLPQPRHLGAQSRRRPLEPVV